MADRWAIPSWPKLQAAPPAMSAQRQAEQAQTESAQRAAYQQRMAPLAQIAASDPRLQSRPGLQSSHLMDWTTGNVVPRYNAMAGVPFMQPWQIARFTGAMPSYGGSSLQPKGNYANQAFFGQRRFGAPVDSPAIQARARDWQQGARELDMMLRTAVAPWAASAMQGLPYSPYLDEGQYQRQRAFEAYQQALGNSLGPQGWQASGQRPAMDYSVLARLGMPSGPTIRTPAGMLTLGAPF